MLAVNLFTAEFHFRASPVAKSQQIAEYFADLATQYQARGYDKLDVFLDRNTAHKAKMQNIYASLTTQLRIQVKFHLMAPYSPALNLVEYAIHLIRVKALHHADCKKSLPEFETYIKELCDDQKILTKEQIVNILQHIESLVPNL